LSIQILKVHSPPQGDHSITKDQRKVQFTGNSTYIVSLPIKWIHDTGIEVGDALTLTPMPNKTLHISYSAVSTERSDLKAMIEYSHLDSAENNFRILISNYLAGYNIIKLTSVKGFSAHDRKFIKDSVRQKLIGLELIEESRTELVFQCLLNYSDLFLRRVIKNMYGLVRSMLEDSMKALRDYNVGIAEDVIQRDDDVDRFYFLSVRQLNAAIEDIELSDTIGIRHPQECLEYRLITKIIERIGDHAVKIAVNTQRIDSAVSPDNPIFKMAELAINVFKSSVDSIAQEDLQTINKTVEEAKNISQFGVSLESRKLGYTGNVEISMILESLRRIAEYSGDIAEASMNMNVKI